MTAERQRIAEELLGVPLIAGGFATCPGVGKHTNANGVRDFRVVLDGAPTGYCFHASCGDEVAAFNKELRRRIWFAEHGSSPAPHADHWAHGVAAEPKSHAEARPSLDRYAVWEFTRGVPSVDEAWFARRSPINVTNCSSIDFLEKLYLPGERVLVFTDQKTQGDFVAWIRQGTYRLSQQRGVKAVASQLPQSGPDGVWFLVQPVTGQWEIRPEKTLPSDTELKPAQYTRRSQVNVTAWRYFVLESDELEAAEWMKVVANLALPVAAIYTSGKRSIHALVRCEVEQKSMWDATRNLLRQIVCPLGADPAALTAVRLSRLPCCKRGGHMQRLLYLDPDPDHSPIRLMTERRGGDEGAAQ